MRDILKHFAKQYITWRFRQRPLFLITFSISGAVLAANLSLRVVAGTLIYKDITFKLTQETSIPVQDAVTVVSLLIFLLSFTMLLIQSNQELAKKATQKVLVIEGRGLRNDDGMSLAANLSKVYPQLRIPLLLDLRQGRDGKIDNPEALIPIITATKDSLNQFLRGNSRDDTQIVYGGLTAVPFTFLTGVELDDESAISVFDWDRTSERWRSLDELDDGHRLSNPKIENIKLADHVLLAVSVSYQISETDLATSFDFPTILMSLVDCSSNNHWSGAKQSALADQFFEIAKKLSARGVKHIHLVLAAPNSVVFKFGRRYDKRNLPELTVYQYEQSQNTKYPWGVRMPVCATPVAKIERTTLKQIT